jgi:hypothetical protein
MNNRMNGATDDELTVMLAEMFEMREPIPDAALQAAYSAIDMDLLSEELAALVFDSASAGELVAMRAPEAEARLLSFVNDHVTIDLELHAGGPAIVGQLSPPTDAELIVEVEAGDAVTVPVDEFGRFRVAVPSGPIRLRLVGLVVTPWITR